MLSWRKSSKFKEPNVALGLPSPNGIDIISEKANIYATDNAGIESVLSREQKRKRGQFGIFSDTEQITIAKYAVVNGNTAAARHYAKILSRFINESAVRGYVKKDKQRFPKMKDADDITELPQAKHGKHLLIVE